MPKYNLRKINVKPYKDVKEYTNLHTIVEVNNLITFIFGTIRLKIKQGEFVKMGKFYRSYALILAILFLFVSAWEARKFFKSFQNESFTTIFFVNLCSLIISFTAYLHALLNNALNPDISVKLYKMIADIDDKLKINTFSTTYKYKIVSMYVIYITYIILIYIFGSIHNPISENYIREMFYLSIACIDFEILNCMFEANEISRRFEILNDCFKIYIMKYFNQNIIDFELQEGILKKLWKRVGNESEKTENITDIKGMINIFNSLTNAVNCMNSNFSVKVLYFSAFDFSIVTFYEFFFNFQQFFLFLISFFQILITVVLIFASNSVPIFVCERNNILMPVHINK